MGLKNDLPLLAGLVLILSGTVFATGNAGLPGIGVFDNPFDDIVSTDPETNPENQTYDIVASATLDSTFSGAMGLKGFSYQTPESGLSLSIADTGDLSLGGADAVRVTTKVTNTDTDRVFLENTKRFGELPASDTEVVDTKVTNVPAGNYEIKYTVAYNPKYAAIEDPDNQFTETYDIQVPKVRN